MQTAPHLQHDILQTNQSKNLIIETLIERITKQEQQIQILTSPAYQHHQITFQQLLENRFSFYNLDGTKKYVLLDITHLNHQQPFSYPAKAKLIRLDEEVWEGIIGVEIKQRIRHTESYCEMLLSDLQSMQQKIEELQNRCPSHSSHKIPSNNNIQTKRIEASVGNKGRESPLPSPVKKQEDKPEKSWNDLFPTFQQNKQMMSEKAKEEHEDHTPQKTEQLPQNSPQPIKMKQSGNNKETPGKTSKIYFIRK